MTFFVLDIEIKYLILMTWFEVYEDGKVCISILHPPGEDEFNEFVSYTVVL